MGEPNKIEQNCGNCKFYSYPPEWKVRACRRFPPKPVFGEEYIVLARVETLPDDWCGEWKMDQSEHDIEVTRLGELLVIPREKRTEENQKEINDLSFWLAFKKAK